MKNTSFEELKLRMKAIYDKYSEKPEIYEFNLLTIEMKKLETFNNETDFTLRKNLDVIHNIQKYMFSISEKY